MIGVKGHHHESLIGQAGEIEPVYDRYALSFFLYDKANRRLHLPQYPSGTAQPSLEQSMEDRFFAHGNDGIPHDRGFGGGGDCLGDGLWCKP